MPEQNDSFECTIVDPKAQEHFRAKVVIAKKQPVRTSRHDDKRIELAHLYIYALFDTWKGAAVSFTPGPDGTVQASNEDENYARRNDRPKDHSHFVVFDLTGKGKYIRRNRYGTDEEVRPCSTWDLGAEFGDKVSRVLERFM